MELLLYVRGKKSPTQDNKNPIKETPDQIWSQLNSPATPYTSGGTGKPQQTVIKAQPKPLSAPKDQQSESSQQLP